MQVLGENTGSLSFLSFTPELEARLAVPGGQIVGKGAENTGMLQTAENNTDNSRTSERKLKTTWYTWGTAKRAAWEREAWRFLIELLMCHSAG